MELIEEAADQTWGKVHVWNAMKELDIFFEVDRTTAERDDELTYTCLVRQNIGSKANTLAVIPLDADNVEYVPRSSFGGAVPVPSGLTSEELAKLCAYGGWRAPRELSSSCAGEIGSIAWIKSPGTGQGVEFGFSVKVKTVTGKIDMTAAFYEGGRSGIPDPGSRRP